MDKILYGLTTVKASKEEDRVIEFIATSEIIDYDGEIIKTEGLDIKGIKKNKSFLWSHKQGDLPVGKIISIKKDGKDVIGKAQLTSEEEYPFGYTVYKLIRGGYINNVSMSFIPDYSTVEYKDIKGKQVRIINNSTLLEISAVNIGANKNAMITSKSFVESMTKAFDEGEISGFELDTIVDKMCKGDLQCKIKTLESKIVELKGQIEITDSNDNMYEELFKEYVSDSADLDFELLVSELK